MRGSIVLLAVITGFVLCQYIEVSFPAPGISITGLCGDEYYDYLWCLDSFSKRVYKIDPWNGEIFDSFDIPLAENPVGLAYLLDQFWYAEGGTAVVYSCTEGGTPVDSWDLSEAGIQAISGLGYELYDEDHLIIADSLQKIVFEGNVPDFSNIYVYFDLYDCPAIFDIAVEVFEGLAVACEDSVSPVRLYYSPRLYTPLGDGEYESALAVTHWWDGRIYFSDPEMGLIHRYCPNMGGCEEQEELTTEVLSASPNPFRNTVDLILSINCPATVCITDLYGRTIISEPFTGNYVWQSNEFPEGVYFAQVITENGTRSSIKLVKLQTSTIL